jgi:hypothetical protein
MAAAASVAAAARTGGGGSPDATGAASAGIAGKRETGSTLNRRLRGRPTSMGEA